MATSSITKDFVVHDPKTFERLLKDLEKQPSKPVRPSTKSSLQRGKEKLAQLSSDLRLQSVFKSMSKIATLTVLLFT